MSFDEFTQQSEDEILQEMQNQVPDVDTKQGSFVYDVQKPTAHQIYNTRVDLNTILMYAFVQTANDKFLDLAGEGRGVPRTLGEKAIGQVTFNGVANTIVPINTIVQSSSDIRFLTASECIILNTGNVTVGIVAENIGSAYDVPENSVNQLPIAISGVTSVSNVLKIEGGTDNEEDDDYRVRILQRLTHPPSSGNKDDYIRWGEEVSGVKGVKPVPLWNGGGTVKVIVYGENGVALDPTIIQNVQNHINPQSDGYGEGTAPIGAHVTVVTSTNKTIDIKIVGLSSTDLDLTKTYINNSLTALLLTIQPGQTLKYMGVIACIASTVGVDDFSSILMNNSNSNITSTDEEKLTLGSVTYE